MAAELAGAAAEVRSAGLWLHEATEGRDALIVAALRAGWTAERVATTAKLSVEAVEGMAP
jgi:hypothetical protein